MRSARSSDDPTDALHLHVFRVSEGLGNACLMELPDGSCGVVDWGTQRQDALDSLLEITSDRPIRFVAASHAHADHTLGLAMLLRTCHQQGVPVQRFVYPATTLDRAAAHLTRARRVARECGVPMSSIGVDDFPGPEGTPEPPYLAWSGKGGSLRWELRVLSPSLTRIGNSEVRAAAQGVVPGNETSLVILFRFVGESGKPGVGRALLPGDATPATLRFARRIADQFAELGLDNQAFVVPHHGSSRNLPEWLESYLHDVIVISSRTDSLRHPAAGILDRLSRRSCRDGVSSLFCNSYARSCFEKFGHLAGRGQRHLVRPGNCFGDVVIRVPRAEPAMLIRSSAPGEVRRPFGYCGNVR